MKKVAAIQMTSTPNVEENLNMAAHFIEKAANSGAELVVLPEMFCISGLNMTDKLAIKEDFGHGKIQNFLANQAKTKKVWIVGGTIPVTTKDKNKVRASCLVFSDLGEFVERYDKIHLFDVTLGEKEIYRESDVIEYGSEIKVTDTPLGKLGLAVCYDIRFPELFRAMSNRGAQIFSLPSAFTMKTGKAHWELLLRSRAVENFSYVIGAAQVGKHENERETYGHSMIIDPWGSIVAKKEEPEAGIITAVIDLDYLKNIRKSMPSLEHQKIFVTN